MTDATFYSLFDSPVGELLLTSDGEKLTGLHLPATKGPDEVGPDGCRDDGPFRVVREQLRAYFAGELRDFDVPLGLAGTAFQRRVWRALCDIPYGETLSYADLARRVGQPGAARAVGSANGANPVAIIVPCHRVIAADGTLGGYGGGLDRKQWLLRHEGAACVVSG
jgi:methylated-DNA-[protein]-cysteine S-methyltransferase